MPGGKFSMEEDTAWRRLLPGGGYFIEEDITWRRILPGGGYCPEENLLWKRISSSDDHAFRACLSSPFADTRAEPAYAMYKLTYKIAHDAFHASWATWNFKDLVCSLYFLAVGLLD